MNGFVQGRPEDPGDTLQVHQNCLLAEDERLRGEDVERPAIRSPEAAIQQVAKCKGNHNQG